MQKGSPFKGARKGQLAEKRTPDRRVTARRRGKVEVLCGAEEMSQDQSETDYSTRVCRKTLRRYSGPVLPGEAPVIPVSLQLSSSLFCSPSPKPYGSRIKVGGKHHLSPHNLKAGRSPLSS